MTGRYFQLHDDVHVPGRWYVRSPVDLKGQEVTPWIFTDGTAIPDPGRMKIPINRPGKPLDFSLTGLSIPVVHTRVAAIVSELAPDDVQSFPVEIEGHPDSFRVLVATRTIRCIDDAACTEVEFWTPEDGQPEKVGQYRDVYGMKIDPSKVGDAKVFRPWGWTIVLLVSEEIKNALEHMCATGCEFQEV